MPRKSLTWLSHPISKITYLGHLGTHQVSCWNMCESKLLHKFSTLCSLSRPRSSYKKWNKSYLWNCLSHCWNLPMMKVILGLPKSFLTSTFSVLVSAYILNPYTHCLFHSEFYLINYELRIFSLLYCNRYFSSHQIKFKTPSINLQTHTIQI